MKYSIWKNIVVTILKREWCRIAHFDAVIYGESADKWYYLVRCTICRNEWKQKKYLNV